MLDELYKINWKELKHAYGEADDVPILIELLLSKDKVERDEARYELYGNIYHQGTIYDATGYAIPFLIELLANEAVIDKFEIFCLIGFIYQGYYREQPTINALHKIAEKRFELTKFYDGLSEAEKEEFSKVFENDEDEADEEVNVEDISIFYEENEKFDEEIIDEGLSFSNFIKNKSLDD